MSNDILAEDRAGPGHDGAPRAPLLPALVGAQLSREELAGYSASTHHADASARPPQRRRRRLRSRLRALRPAPPRRGGGLPHHPLGRLRRRSRRRGCRGAERRDPGAASDAWTTKDDRVSQLVRLYAIESGQPGILKNREREALAGRWRISDGPGNEYSRVHEEANMDHAAEGRSLIKARPRRGQPPTGPQRPPSQFFKANWHLPPRRSHRLALSCDDRGADRRTAAAPPPAGGRVASAVTTGLRRDPRLCKNGSRLGSARGSASTSGGARVAPRSSAPGGGLLIAFCLAQRASASRSLACERPYATSASSRRHPPAPERRSYV